MLGKIEGISSLNKEKRASEDEMAGWHHRRNGQELGQTLGGGAGQGRPGMLPSMGHEESDTTGQLNNNTEHQVVEKK